jgi:hypothetical protein
MYYYDKELFLSGREENDKPKICTEIVEINGQQGIGDNHTEANSTGMGTIQHG